MLRSAGRGNRRARLVHCWAYFGHAMKECWALDPSVTYLNHGTVGAPPRRVLEVQQKLRDEIERQPSRFLLRELAGVRLGATNNKQPLLRAAADEVARFLGAEGKDLVFVDNATSGINAVLRTFPFIEDDEVLLLEHAYGAVRNAADYATRVRGAAVRSVWLALSSPSLVLIVRRTLTLWHEVRLLPGHIRQMAAKLRDVAEVKNERRRDGEDEEQI